MRSIKKRCKAAIVKEIQLSKVLESDMIDRVGWIEAVRTLFSSVIISTLTYGTQAYVFMNKNQLAEIEGCMKNVLYRMLKISKFSQYAAVLMECNLVRIKHIVNQLKIGFLHDLVHEKGSGFCLEILRKEQELFPGTGLIAEVAKLCELYELDDVSIYKNSKDKIKENVWEYGRIEIWKETLGKKKIPYCDNHARRHRFYSTLPRYQAKLYFAYKIGELQFKDYRRGEYIKKFGDTLCFTGCGQPDSLEHVMNCKGYATKWNGETGWEDLNSINTLVDYLRELDRERTSRFKLPVIYRQSLREACKT